MSNFGISAWALKQVLDPALRITRPDGRVYLRIENNPIADADEFATYGFQAAVSGLAGTSDILIEPPPDVDEMSMHNIGMSGGKLLIGAHTFLISDTWVKRRMQDLGYEHPEQVFHDKSVIGLIWNSMLFSIESIDSRDVGEEHVSWMVTANRLYAVYTEPKG